MPTCLACAKCWPILTGALCAVNSQRSMSQWIAFQRSSTQIQLLGGGPFYRNHTGLARRALETLATASESPIMRIPSHQHTLTLLHKTMSFLDHALDDSLITKGNSEKLSFWRGSLSELSVELSAGETANSKARVASESSVPSSCGSSDCFLQFMEWMNGRGQETSSHSC